MENERRKFIKLHYEVLTAQELSPCEKIVFSLLETYTQSLDCCFISNSTIAEKCGISEITVKRAINVLKEKKWILTWKLKDGKKLRRAITTNKLIFEDKEKLNQLKDKLHEHEHKELFDYDWLNERD